MLFVAPLVLPEINMYAVAVIPVVLHFLEHLFGFPEIIQLEISQALQPADVHVRGINLKVVFSHVEDNGIFLPAQMYFSCLVYYGRVCRIQTHIHFVVGQGGIRHFRSLTVPGDCADAMARLRHMIPRMEDSSLFILPKILESEFIPRKLGILALVEHFGHVPEHREE